MKNIILFLLLFCISCAQTKYEVKDIVLFPIEIYNKKSLPIDIYISKSDFSLKEIQIVKNAAKNWATSTNNKVQFNIIEWEPKEDFSLSFYKDYYRYTLWKKNGYNKEVLNHFLKYSITANGYTVGNYILLVEDGMDEEKLFITATHEFGHLLGLEHCSMKNCLMNIGGNRGIITELDLIQFRYIYDK